MDAVGFRTLGGGAACDAKLGARPHERHGHHDLAGGDGGWGSDLGFGYLNRRSYTLLGAAVLFLTSLLLARRLSINFAGNLEKRVSGVLSIRVESQEVTPIALTRELLAACMIWRRIMKNKNHKNGHTSG